MPTSTGDIDISAGQAISKRRCPCNACPNVTRFQLRETELQPHRVIMKDQTQNDTASEELERLCQSFVAAVNNRQLSRSYPVWNFFAPTFRAEPDIDPDLVVVNLDELMAQIQGVIDIYPTHHIEIFTFDTKVTEKTGNAQVFMTTELTGCPPGVRRQNAVIFEFKKMEGSWRAVWYRGLRGTGGLDSGFGGL